MGIKIEKKEVPAKTTLVAVHVPDAEIADDQIVSPDVIDEALELELKIEKHMKKIEADVKRLAEIKSQVLAVVVEVTDADTVTTLMGTGTRGMEVSARSSKTEIINLEQAKKYLGTETFWKVAKIGITDLKAYLTKPQYEAVTETTKTGGRRLKLIG